MGRPAEDPPGWLGDYKKINVDPSELTRYAGSIEGEIDTNFVPHAERIFNIYSGGSSFGRRIFSGEVYAAQEKHRMALVQTGESITNYVEASKVLVAAMRQIAQNYSTADLMTGTRSAEINTIINDAMAMASERVAAAGGVQLDEKA